MAAQLEVDKEDRRRWVWDGTRTETREAPAETTLVFSDVGDPDGERLEGVFPREQADRIESATNLILDPRDRPTYTLQDLRAKFGALTLRFV